MFARIVEFIPKLEKKEEFVKVIRNEVLPILKKQTGFMELLPFFPEIKNEKVIAVTLWTEKGNAERYGREVYPESRGDPEALSERLRLLTSCTTSRPPCVNISWKLWLRKQSRSSIRGSRSGI